MIIPIVYCSKLKLCDKFESSQLPMPCGLLDIVHLLRTILGNLCVCVCVCVCMCVYKMSVCVLTCVHTL
jgi:hypothetical protein